MKSKKQIKDLLIKNKIDSQYFDLQFLEEELRTFQKNIQKVKMIDTFPKTNHVFSHIQVRGDLINDEKQ